MMSTPSSRGQFARFRPPFGFGDNNDSDSSSGGDLAPFVRFTRPLVFESTSEGENSDEVAMRDEYWGPNERWVDSAISVRKYIDDFSSIEKVPKFKMSYHLSTGRPKLSGCAYQSQKLFVGMATASKDKGMRINPAKTQMLCIGASGSEVETFIKTGASVISSASTDTLKILGFVFGPRPTVEYQVNYLMKKFKGKMWCLYHLKQSGMDSSDLTFIYKTVLLPILDYSCVTYHSLLTAGLEKLLEGLQRRVVTIIHGRYQSYTEVLDSLGLELLKTRRENMVRKFSIKNSSRTAWFPPNANPRNLRPREKYAEFFAKTNRLQNSPLFYMRRILNEMF